MFCFSNAYDVSIYKSSGFVVSICDFWPTLISIAPELASRECLGRGGVMGAAILRDILMVWPSKTNVLFQQ